MRIQVAWISGVLFSSGCFGQTAAAPEFAVASLKPSQNIVGRDARGRFVTGPDRLSARNVSLKDLIVEAYHVQPYQVSGGPRWLDSDEFDVDAKADGSVSKEELRRMLQTLVTGRFQLSLHRETRDTRMYALIVDKQGPRIQPAKEEENSSGGSANAGPSHFHGDLQQLANLISIQLTIPPLSDDPTRPSVASGAPIPVVDQTGLQGIYDIHVEIRPEAGGDMFTLWQRVLEDQLGLKLESRRGPAEFLVIDRAQRMPAAN